MSQLQKDLKAIEHELGDTHSELMDGLPDGSDPEWGYDEKLVHDIAEAVRAWKMRKDG